MRDYRRYAVHGRAHQLALDVYRVTGQFPDHERFGLTGQLRRAAASIPINIAEGAGRDSDVEFSRFLDIAAASANEVEYELLLARDLSYLASSDYDNLVRETTEIRKCCTASGAAFATRS